MRSDGARGRLVPLIKRRCSRKQLRPHLTSASTIARLVAVISYDVSGPR
jgi:hypothetical protein